jgi:hypothetical protein
MGKHSLHENNEQPSVVSRALGEGGYTFLKRALATALQDQEGAVVVSTGTLELTYVNDPSNITFMDGIRSVRSGSDETLHRFSDVASRYVVEQGLAELAAEQETLSTR